MTLVFVGGARGEGKSYGIRQLVAQTKSARHIDLSSTIRLALPEKDFKGRGAKMRNLPKRAQLSAIQRVVERLKAESEGKFVFIDGHFTSYFNGKRSDNFPTIRNVAKLFDFLVLFKTSPQENVWPSGRRRAIQKGHLARFLRNL